MMPVVTVDVVGIETVPTGWAGRLADAIGEVLGSAAGGSWVTVHPIPTESYAENRTTVAQPVMIRVLERVRPDPNEVEERARAIVGAVSGIVGRPPENIHVIYEDSAVGRVAFGGRLVRE